VAVALSLSMTLIRCVFKTRMDKKGPLQVPAVLSRLPGDCAVIVGTIWVPLSWSHYEELLRVALRHEVQALPSHRGAASRRDRGSEGDLPRPVGAGWLDASCRVAGGRGRRLANHGPTALSDCAAMLSVWVANPRGRLRIQSTRPEFSQVRELFLWPVFFCPP
jgi:hypothetical protein